MKWPWVSRELLDLAERRRCDAIAEHEAEVAGLYRVIGEWDKRFYLLFDKYDALLEKFTALRVAGAVPEPKPIVLTPEQTQRMTLRDRPDEMLSLIDAKAGGNLRMRGMMLRQLAADRAAGVSDEDIRAGIMNGVPGNGVPS